MVQDGRTGLLISQQDPKLYAEAILRLLRNPSEASMLAEAALRSIQKLDARKVSQETERMYEGLRAKQERR